MLRVQDGGAALQGEQDAVAALLGNLNVSYTVSSAFSHLFCSP
jgi:hypothetical protein